MLKRIITSDKGVCAEAKGTIGWRYQHDVANGRSHVVIEVDGSNERGYQGGTCVQAIVDGLLILPECSHVLFNTLE